jgi:uncharacterized membrane protein required for colicin V production
VAFLAPALLAVDASADVGAIVLAFAFLAWGALRGALRQALGLAVLVVAFPVATWATPHLESTVEKVVSLSPSALTCTAWLTAFVGVLAVGGVAIHAFRAVLSRTRIFGPADRWVAAVIGLVKGVVAAAVVAFTAMGHFADDPKPPTVVRSVEESRTARALVDLERSTRSFLKYPPAVSARLAGVGVVGRGRAAAPAPAPSR